MSSRKQLVIGRAGEAPLAIRALIDMLRYAREQTLSAVRGLTIEQLDHRHDETSNSIGVLLWHLAATEVWYQVNSFEARDWSPADAAEWDVPLDLGEAARSHGGFPLEHYVEMLAAIRARTERELLARDEEWLLRVEPLDNVDANNYWKWFHVCEDGVAHTGQIRWLRKRLPQRSGSSNGVSALV